MTAKFIAAAALAASLLAASADAQSPADLLQRGIYTQETAGNPDGAIPIYRQVIGSGAPHELKAQAQTHLVGAMLQKGDLAAAGQEFEKLARDYSDEEKLVDSTAQRLRAIAQNGPALVLGTFQNGKYHHHWTGVEFTVPSGWTFKDQHVNPDVGDGVDLIDSNSTGRSHIFIRRKDTPAAKLADRLQERWQFKLTVQRDVSRGYVAYHVRPESVQTTIIGGQQALVAVADYLGPKGEKLIETHTFIQSEKTEMDFALIAGASEFPGVQSRFDQILRSVLIP